ncbi:MAG: transmembrane 220 family protein [Gammaproteobacteria bacterium]|nr:transmembrane 220 family protein [Gammaproteobacteria bacterium]
MRYLNLLFAILMLVFIVVQYNDPDGLLWMFIYLIPALWALLAAFWPRWLTNPLPAILLGLCIVLSIGLMIFYWPKTSGWWRQEVWWEVETAREGMGMMIVSIVLLVAWFTSRRASKNRALRALEE